MSLLDVYNRYVVDLDLALAKMSHAGVLMDLKRRATMLADAKQEMTHLMTEMNRVVPDRAKVAEPKLGFFREPKATAGLARRVFNVPVKVCPHCGLEKPSKKDLLRCGLTKEQLIVMAFPEERWCRLRPFVPSNAQVITYQRTMGHPLRYSSKKKPGKGKVKSITADEKALGRLIKKVPADPLYPLILRYRDVEHRIGQIESLTIGSDNRVHTTFLHTPSTLRLASGLPAMQNIPPDLRTLFIPGPGNRLFKVDWSGIEAQLVGYFMGGENGRNYLRLAKLGVHAYFMSHVVGRPASLSWSDADLREYFAELKKDADTYKRAKQTVHASNYRETPYGMHMQQPGIFPTVRDAEFYQKLYYEVVPGLTDWHWHTCIEAERDGLLRNPWGFPHRFYDVFRYERNAFTGEWDKFFGIMANAAIAFKPQSTAGMLMRGAILTCAENEELLRALRLTIHDELFGEAEVDKVSRIYYAVKSIMERPIPQLPLDPAWGMGHFLSIETEGKIIDRWAPIPAAVTA